MHDFVVGDVGAVDKIRKELYTATPNGLCGNEDCGQMSAWYVFSAMGFYPVNPVEMKYQLGTPLFKKLTLKVGREKRFIIKANKENDQYIYVQKVLLNGEELHRTYINIGTQHGVRVHCLGHTVQSYR